MGVMDKFLNYMKLNEDGEYEDEYYDDDEPDMMPMPKKAPAVKGNQFRDKEEDFDEDPEPVRKPVRSNPGKVTPIHNAPARKNGSSGGMEVCVIKPNSFDDAREITETLLKNRTVVMNLEGLDVEVAQRILDFTSGSCFAINGTLQKISLYIFIITPASVDVSGDFQAMIGNFDTTIFNNNGI